MEVALRTAGWAEPNEIGDPYVGFSEIHPLFVASADGKKLEVAANRQPLFQPDSFLANKPADEFRIFCLGGSTVQGRPYSIETSFTTWLELALNSTDSPDFDRRAEVVNCGGVSYASYRLVPILEEVINYSPDLIVLYTGHNEFLEDRTYRDVKTTSSWLAKSHQTFSRLHTYRFARSYFKGARPSSNREESKTRLPAEVEARLDYRDGLKQYHRDDQWQAVVVQHYEFNLRRMVNAAQQADIPLVLINPVSNLRNIEPFKNQHGDAISQENLDRCDQLWIRFAENESAGLAVGDLKQVEILKKLVAIDDRYALTYFRLAQAFHANGDLDRASKHFVLAKENDICPLRMLESMHDVVFRVVEETQTPLVDLRKYLEDRADDGIPGRESFVDHVHPTIFCHQLLAKLLVERLNSLELVVVADEWETKSDDVFQAHLKTLPFMYFQRGRDRLDGLKRWAEGRVTKERSSIPTGDDTVPRN